MNPSLLHLNTMVTVIPMNRNSHITVLKTDLSVLPYLFIFPTVYALKLYEYACNVNKYENMK